MNTDPDRNDELRTLWQSAGRQNHKEAEKIMQLVEARAKSFERTIFWRNIREYAAAAVAGPLFLWLAYIGRDPIVRVGNFIVGASAIWILIFMWLMQRSRSGPPPESSGKDYQNRLLAIYDRQITLLKTAWLWYALPLTAGLALSTFGSARGSLSLRAGIGCLMVLFGIGLGVLNWNAAKRVAKEKEQLTSMLDSAE
jgi:hypothetical protein